MTNQVIPVEAVEAAAKAAYEVAPIELFGRDSPVAWEQLGDSPLGQHHKDRELRKARATLEAAAPHMLAEAWDEGHVRGFWNGRMSQLTVPYDAPDPLIGKQDAETNNPYRSQS